MKIIQAAFLILGGLVCLPSSQAQDPTAAATEGNREEPAIPSLEEVMVVTASRTEQRVQDAPVAVSVIGDKQIATAATVNIAELIRGTPGVSVVQTSTRDFNLRSRGAATVAENNQLVLLDGRSIYLDFYGIVLWDFLPVAADEIRRIEIQRGPGSAVWGANALAGVVNVLTKSPRELQGGLISVSAGELDHLGTSFRWAEEIGRLSYKISGGYLEEGRWPRDDRLADGQPVPRGYSFASSGTEQSKLDLRADYETTEGALWSFKSGGAGTSGILHSRLGPFLIEDDSNVSYAEVDWTAGAVDAKVYWNRLRGDATNLLSQLPFSFDVDTYAADATSRLPLSGRHLLVYGASVRANRFDLSLAPLETSRDDFGVFAEDLVQLGSRANLSVGARLDYFDTIGSAISPRMSLVYKLTSDHSLRFAWNRAYRAPTLVDNYLSATLPGVFVIGGSRPFIYPTRAAGNEKLAEERIDAFEIGYTFTFSRGLASAAVYDNSTLNNIVFVPVDYYSPDSPPPGWPLSPGDVPRDELVREFSFRNIGEVRDRGLELALQLHLGRLSTSTSYTWQDDPVSSSASVTLNRPARNQASFAAWIGGEKRYQASFSATYTGKAFWADVLDSRFWGTTDEYTLVNLAAGVRSRSGNGEVVVSITNIFDERIKQHVFGDVIGRKATVTVNRRFGNR